MWISESSSLYPGYEVKLYWFGACLFVKVIASAYRDIHLCKGWIWTINGI